MKNYLMLAACLMLTVQPARSESLWNETKGSLFTDIRAAKVGDIITVLVSESSTSSQTASTDVSRDSSFSTGKGIDLPILRQIPGLSYSGESTSNGEGSTQRTSNLVTRMTATVVQVMDNGNLSIEGYRELKTNDEKQTLKLTGTVRPQDVSPSNTISSTLIADAKIEMTGKGPIGDRQKEGIFSRIIRFLF